MTKRAVIFDFGGVIFKTRDYTPRHTWDRRLGLPPGSVEQAVHNAGAWRAAQRGEITLSAYWADVAGRLGIDAATAATDLARDFYAGDEADAAVLALIRRLRADGHTVALLSNDAAGLLRPRLAALDITRLFDPLVISSEVGVMKPDPGAYAAILTQLARPAQATVFIDDMLPNIDGAQAAGIHGIHYRDGMDLMAALEPLLRVS